MLLKVICKVKVSIFFVLIKFFSNVCWCKVLILVEDEIIFILIILCFINYEKFCKMLIERKGGGGYI